jgi:hypothetical protein
MMQFAIQGLLSFGELQQLQKSGGMKIDVCKQLIDRGAALTVTTRLLHLMSRHKLLKSADSSDQAVDEIRTEIKQLAGVLAGRAFLVEKRAILQDLYIPLLDFLDFFDGREQSLSDALQSLQETFQEAPQEKADIPSTILTKNTKPAPFTEHAMRLYESLMAFWPVFAMRA